MTGGQQVGHLAERDVAAPDLAPPCSMSYR
jgi:hypothetical protein